jgi:hypothetical protein
MKIFLRMPKGWSKPVENKSKETCDIDGAKLWIGPKPVVPVLTEQESKVLRFLEDEIYNRHRSPSLRDVSRVLGLQSSRSGSRVFRSLISKGLAYRCRHGKLGLMSHC